MSKADNAWLLDYYRNDYSQAGEDGILEKILSILPLSDKPWCVEFGAWDGAHLSNTTSLIERRQFAAVLIEPDQTRFQVLTRRFRDRADVVCFQQFVGFDGPETLDRILEKTPVPIGFDLLSIDIDGNDYHVWKAVQKYLPRIVCIEFNPTIPDDVLFVQPPSPTVQQGASVAALHRLAREKGYEPICITTGNLICVRREWFSLFDIRDNSVAALRRDRSLITYLFCGYDGSVHLAGCRTMPWHQVPYSLRKMQHLPRFLQAYPDNYGSVTRLAYRIVRKLRAIASSR
jgi:Ni,Fe-hydrogenase III small subunit